MNTQRKIRCIGGPAHGLVVPFCGAFYNHSSLGADVAPSPTADEVARYIRFDVVHGALYPRAVMYYIPEDMDKQAALKLARDDLE